MFKFSIHMLGDNKPINYGKFHISKINYLQELQEDSGILLLNLNREKQDDILKNIHKDKKLLKWLIFVKEESSLSPFLSDGIIDFEEVVNEFKYLQNKIGILKNETDPLFLWLWMNPKRRLKPFKNINNKSLYNYPLIDIYYPDSKLSHAFILNKTNDNFLKRENLIDRVRNCPSCNSAFINYIDTCPKCSSINIVEESSLHCFNCGEVNKQKLFLKNNKIQCPNCLVYLRHIGVDYDRPIEQLHCNDCHHTFSENNTLANCLHCNSTHEINSLITRQIFNYSIGEQADSFIKYGYFISAPDFNINSKVNADYFIKMLDWVNKLAIRHKQNHLLISLHIKNFKEVISSLGEMEIINIIEEISHRLNSILRNTDICCQFNDSTLLLFFPMVEENDINILQKKLSVLENIIEADISFDSSFFILPEKEYYDDFEFWLSSNLGGSNE